jgi:hypothetical protein
MFHMPGTGVPRAKDKGSRLLLNDGKGETHFLGMEQAGDAARIILAPEWPIEAEERGWLPVELQQNALRDPFAPAGSVFGRDCYSPVDQINPLLLVPLPNLPPVHGLLSD